MELWSSSHSEVFSEEFGPIYICYLRTSWLIPEAEVSPLKTDKEGEDDTSVVVVDVVELHHSYAKEDVRLPARVRSENVGVVIR
jgi:hypothetical protein